ncbi:MAG TPA: metal ABC transporter ATP-binding protein [Acidimicrobiales bacterium]|nr:metal ABC transporter ATP-binding protein [Acidimicrobiales bacterium]
MAPATPAGGLKVEGVDVSLGGRQILRDVSFSIGPGELNGLIGPNGAGKTTLLRVILGLQAADNGRVVLPGDGDHAHHHAVGYVPQKVLLDPDMPLRARDVVALGLDGNRLGLPLAHRRRRLAVDEMLAAVGASHLADARVGLLSGGEQQRVLIAHALVSRPPLLLLDEPLANLDLRAGQEVVELLAKITRHQHVSVLISAHDMNPLLPVMDRIVYIAGGRVASGTTDEVVRSEVLSALYGQHVDVLKVHGRFIVVTGQPDRAEPGDGHGHDHLEPPDEPGIFSIR